MEKTQNENKSHKMQDICDTKKKSLIDEPLFKILQVTLCMHSVEIKADAISRAMIILSEPFYLIPSLKPSILAYSVVILNFLFVSFSFSAD